MTLQQEAYKRIDQMSDEGLQFVIDLIDKMKFLSISGFKVSSDRDENDSPYNTDGKRDEADSFPVRPVVALPEEDEVTKKIRAERKKEFMASAGNGDIDEEAIRLLRERSMV